MSEIKVNSIKGVGASTAALTINNTDGTCTANLTNRTNKNLIQNGAFLISQRGTSSTSSGYQTVDRFTLNFSGTDEAPTQAQVDVASGTTPYTFGFRKAYKVTNGNQTSGAGSSDQIYFSQKMEAQNIATSGWNYLSSSSNVTLSFWVKSSVAQNFYGYLLTKDGTTYLYPFETGSLSADTWTKVTKTIPGNSNLTINNDNGAGLELVIAPFFGTNKTGSVSLNAWGTYSSSVRVPDMTSTWYTTNDATFEITGVQLEVSDYATSFEFLSLADELRRCQRYFYMHAFGAYVYTPNKPDSTPMGMSARWTNVSHYGMIYYPVQMRAHPTLYKSLGTDRLLHYADNNAQGFDDVSTQDFGVNGSIVNYVNSLDSSAEAGWIQLNNNNAYVGFDAEI